LPVSLPHRTHITRTGAAVGLARPRRDARLPAPEAGAGHHRAATAGSLRTATPARVSNIPINLSRDQHGLQLPVHTASRRREVNFSRFGERIHNSHDRLKAPLGFPRATSRKIAKSKLSHSRVDSRRAAQLSMAYGRPRKRPITVTVASLLHYLDEWQGDEPGDVEQREAKRQVDTPLGRALAKIAPQKPNQPGSMG
jgi:hypothetical protein